MKQLIVGQTYLAISEACEFEGLENEIHKFEEVRKTVEILPKPATVFEDDGHRQREIPLPKHLAQDNWYRVKNVNTNVIHWLCVDHLKISQVA